LLALTSTRLAEGRSETGNIGTGDLGYLINTSLLQMRRELSEIA
jgi:hypothetical protein